MNYRNIKSKIIRSGIFDVRFYESKYPDVAIIKRLYPGIDLLDHYILIGSRLGRLPHGAFTKADMPPTSSEIPLEDLPALKFIAENGMDFDSAWYLDNYKDVAKAGANPLAHYRNSGRFEMRSPNEKAESIKYLNATWYAARYANQIGREETPVSHYLSKGARQGNAPNGRRHLAENSFRRFGLSEYGSRFDFVVEADTETALAESFSLSIAVHMHVFYDSLLEEMAQHVSNIDAPYDVFISIPTGIYDIEAISERARSCLKGSGRVMVREFENTGRDLAPMAAGFGPELLNYDLLLHIHSKRSPHNPGQSAWRRYLLHYTCGSRSITNQILNYLAESPNVAGCFPPYYGSLRNQPSWGLNLDKVKKLTSQLAIAPVMEDAVPDFPAGSFFWIRPEAIRPLLDGGIDYNDFEAELGQTDNTTAHALERLLGHVPETLGYTNVTPLIDVAHDLRHYYPQDRASPPWKPERIQIAKILGARAALPKNRTAIVTAITGGFDSLIIHEALSADFDYICFSNDPMQDGYGLYDVRKIPYSHPDVRRVARFVKTNLVHLLPEYETIVWLDGNLQLTAPIDGLVTRMRTLGLCVAAIPHPIRSTYMQEAEIALRYKLDEETLIRAQIEKYQADPSLLEQRLIETNFMIFDASDTRVSKVTDTWWSEIRTYSKRDQLSINFALKTHCVDWMQIFDDKSSMRDAPFSRMFSHGAGPRYRRTSDGCLKVISSRARKGQTIREADVPLMSDLDQLRAADSDARVELEQVNELSDGTIVGKLDLRPASENPEDMESERLPNGVSLQNWVPRRWSRQAWSVPIGLSKIHEACCFGGLVTETSIDGHKRGQLVLASDGSLCDASYGVWNGERLLPRDLLTPMDEGSWRLKRAVSPQSMVGDHYLLGSLQPHFGHTLLEGLSRTWALLEYPELFDKMPLLVFEPNLSEYQRRFLQLAGIDEDRIVHIPQDGVTVERLWVPDPAIRSHRWISKKQGTVWQRISASISVAAPTRKVYLSRAHISERPLTNEAQVEELLEGQGFEIVYPETLPLDEQIRVAAEAAHIMGPVGSQMYLAAFQKPGTKKTILAPSNFYAKDDAMISKAIGTDCAVIFGERINNFADRADRRWSIDIESVRSLFSVS